jgi:L-fuculose-phosphate aldolase
MSETILQELCDILKFAYQKEWISTRDGNASYRSKDDSFFYVTPSGVRKQLITPDMLCQIKPNCESVKNFEKLENFERLDKNVDLEPTGEICLHMLFQSKIPDNISSRFVLHLHPTYTVAAMYAGINLQDLADDFPEINRYTRVGPNVPKIAPITKDLAVASAKALNLDKESGEISYDIIGLDRHGIIAIGDSPLEVLEHVERVESVCKIVLAARLNNKSD